MENAHYQHQLDRAASRERRRDEAAAQQTEASQYWASQEADLQRKNLEVQQHHARLQAKEEDLARKDADAKRQVEHAHCLMAERTTHAPSTQASTTASSYRRAVTDVT